MGINLNFSLLFSMKFIIIIYNSYKSYFHKLVKKKKIFNLPKIIGRLDNKIKSILQYFNK